LPNRLRELSDNGAPGFRGAVDFCGQVHEVEFQFMDGAAARVGQAVSLAPGAPPILLAGSRAIGQVIGEVGRALNGCLQMKYALTGAVDRVDNDARRGLAILNGVRKQE
jgi:hypothetical protein